MEPKQSPEDYPGDRFYAKTAEEALASLMVDPEEGLSEGEAKRRLARHGPNLISEIKTRSAVEIFLDQFKSLIVALLGVGAGLSFAFGNLAEGAAILVVILINTLIGFFTELRGIRSMESLRELTRVTAKVRRGEKILEIAAEYLVPGDIVVLEGGDVVPADLRLVRLSRLQADESILTGESLPISKDLKVLGLKTGLPDRRNMVYQGTGITLGSGEGVVVCTGGKTQLGRIASLTGAAKETVTPLEKRISQLSRQLVWMTLALAFVVGGVGILTDKPVLLMVQTAIALAVAAVPEGLPMVATLALARGMWRMAKKNALIERLSAVETLGSTTVIMVDKTGTLTENRMSATWISMPSGDYRVIPHEMGRSADFMKDRKLVDAAKDQALQGFFRAGVLCNTAYLEMEEDGARHYRGVGDPTEVALLVLGAQAGFSHEGLQKAHPEIRLEPFDPERKMMATVHRTPPQTYTAVKGAPEEVLKVSRRVRCETGERDMTVKERDYWLAKNHWLAGRGLRVLAVAERHGPDPGRDIYKDLTFLGLIGLHDPPRQDVPPAIAACRRAGIRVIMVTGDHAVTAAEIARAIGLTKQDHKDVLEGRQLGDLKGLSKKAREKLLSTGVFARVSPKQKLDLIDFYQQRGEIVAMTGDGVNDAPALRKADIGIAMGKRGSQVAREAGDMILRDDRFSTIVSAIAQGRVIFGNIRKFIVYLLSCNISEILVVGLAFLAGLPLPLLPLQILYLNLVTDVFPAFALGAGEGEPGQMKRKPRDPREPILPRKKWAYIATLGAVMTGTVLGAFSFALTTLELPPEKAVTVSFMTLALAQLWHVFNMRDTGSAIFANEITRNPFIWGALVLCIGLIGAAVFMPGLSDVLGLEPLDGGAWTVVLGFSAIPLVFGQLAKAAKLFH